VFGEYMLFRVVYEYHKTTDLGGPGGAPECSEQWLAIGHNSVWGELPTLSVMFSLEPSRSVT